VEGIASTATGNMLVIDGGAGTPDTPDVVRLLVAAGAAIESVVPEEPPLEDVYLRLLDGAEPRA
jgi:hypothetical protein